MLKPLPRKPFHKLALTTLFGLFALAATGADAQPPGPCGEAERMAYLQAVENGMPMEQLVELFGHCSGQPSNLTSAAQKTITTNNAVGNTWYEEMNGCGYNPQAGYAVCDVEVKRTFGYGPFPSGSTEWVTFCFDCGGGWMPVQGDVHVTNDISGTSPSYGFMAYAYVPPICPTPGGGTGTTFPVRATLSWAMPAINPCSTTPTLVWGNQITFDARDDP